MRIIFYRMLVIFFLILAVIGAILPGMPTTIFLILAAWVASKGWPQVDAWLLQHPKYGDSIQQWRSHGAVPRMAKWMATLMMSCSAMILSFSPFVLWAKLIVISCMCSVAIWLWLRPEPQPLKKDQKHGKLH
ncbi:YbaN family protein [Acinetobacter larvae]|uniref:Inner membrane protein n=1 Tax=Acinetobacter larvae TaxID=1789224 RepID=A0A1B2M3Q8_9GAMM|nr:YbaN family protein [Acinetobacter larvae]AOA59840.1 hypothetical protein BFG52_02875 [Acinetobacter larvae]